MWTRLGFQNPLLYIKTLLNYLNLLFFHCSYHRAIVTFLQWQQEFNYFFSPSQSKRKWHVITKQRELQYDCSSPQRCDPWMSVWEHPTTGRIIQWAAFFIWHERRTRVWVTEVNECRKNKSRRSNAIRENRWVSGGGGVQVLSRFPACRHPSSAGSCPDIWLHLYEARDDLLTLTGKEVTSDRLTQQIALQLRTYLGPAAACFSAASIPPTWGHVTRFSLDVLQDSCFRPFRSHFQAQLCTISGCGFPATQIQQCCDVRFFWEYIDLCSHVMPVGLQISKFALSKVNLLHHAKAARMARFPPGAL